MRTKPSRPSVVRLMPVLDFGGAESRIATQAALIDRTRFDFRVCTFWKRGAAARSVEAAGVRVDCLDVDPSPRNPKATARLYEYLRDVGVDVLHASILEANVHAALVRQLPDAPAVAIEEVGMPQRRLAARIAFGAVYRLADVVIGVSERTCAALLSEHFLPRSKVRLIYNSVNPGFLAEVAEPPAREHVHVVAIGRLVEVKNHETLIRAFARALVQVPALRLQIAGEGPLRPKLEALIAELGLVGCVELLGFREGVRDLLDDADVYVISSFSEGTSISLAEAMARARPFVASAADGIDEAVKGYPQGWQVRPTDLDGWVDALMRIGRLPREERSRLGKMARRLVEERMSPIGYAERLHALYDQLAGEGALRRAKYPNVSGAAAGIARRLAVRLR